MSQYHPAVGLLQWTLKCLRRFGPQPADGSATERVGREGEDAAYFYLRRRGYVIVARRWVTPLVDGEVDLIGWHENTLCFIEVKTRSRRGAFAAEFAVDEKKIGALHRMADAYVRHLPLRGRSPESIPTRFDVVSVYLDGGTQPEIQLVRDAFR